MVDRCAEYKKYKKLGEGAYGVVYQALTTKANKRMRSGNKVAIKVCRGLFGRHTGDTKRILREMKLLRQMKDCPNIVQLLDYIPGNRDEVIFVFEYVATDLDQLLADEQYLSQRHCKYIMHQILLGVRQLHKAKIVHRDLKPANILLTLNCTVKICDFNLARSMEWSTNGGLSPETWQQNPYGNKFNKSISQYVVTRWYRAPEVILSSIIRDHVFELDVWSVACIFVEILQMRKANCRNYHLRRPLFPGNSCFPHSHTNPQYLEDDQDQLNLILNVTGNPSKSDLAFYKHTVTDSQIWDFFKRFPFTPKADWSQALPAENHVVYNLLDSMLTLNPKERASIDKVLNHDYFNSVRSAKLEKDVEVKGINWEYETQRGLNGHDYKNLAKQEIVIFKNSV